MNLSSTLNAEIIRIFATILLPGAVVLLAFAVVGCAFQFESAASAIAWITSQLDDAKKQSTVATVMFFILAVGGGIIAETLGARFEYHVCDSRAKKKHKEFSDIWNKYLRLKFDKDPIGQSYLRYLHLHLKFELNFACALMVLAASILILDWRHADLTVHWALYVSLIVSAILLLLESISSAMNLHAVRQELVNEYAKVVA